MLFDGHRALWHWMWSAGAEQTIADVAATMRQYAAADVLLLKCMDGATWQRAYDTGASAPGSVADVQALIRDGEAAGITVVPWVVATRKADAAQHALLGPRLVVDAEPFQHFWDETPADLAAYFAALRAGGVTELYASIDPRPQWLAALGVATWAGSVDGLLPQTYWPDFQEPAASSLPYVEACLSLNPHVYPALPYNATATDLGAFWSACRALGVTGCSLWRMGASNAAQLESFGALPLPAADPCVELRTEVADLRAQLKAAQDAVAQAVQVLSGVLPNV